LVKTAYNSFWKPLADKVVALVLLVLTLPFAIIAVLGLLVFSGERRLLFIQPRPGYLGNVFHLLKFRTLDNTGSTTSFWSALLRKTGMDEWPQLWHILLGEMSFVGPRPLLVEYMSLYNEVQQKRHFVKPGITGWAQVNGRNTQTWDQRFLLDLEYVEKQSFALDCRILGLTIRQLIQKGNATEMPVWQGNKNI
jgi:undecaprenyl phosphate N,N'-diacetylbacillosamine 1-phosphate transferase